MLPIDHFEAAWERCDHLSVIHGFLAGNVAPVLQLDEILRAEWAARVSALDLYVHELIAQKMVAIFEGTLPSCPGFSTFCVPTETMNRIRTAMSATDAKAAFDLTVRDHLSRKTFQQPDEISSGVKLFSQVPLWNEVALHLGATQASKEEKAKAIKRNLKQIIERRNKIVHEGDLQPIIPRTPWPISQFDLASITKAIKDVVFAINTVA
ncbi:MAG: hypothetical protein RLZZ494_1792 [Pseudomonadota bacterium]|jgi:hypothetical protein